MEKLAIGEIERITDCKIIAAEGNCNDFVDDITIDTRKPATTTSLYIPIKGDNFDGHNFIQEFLSKSGGFALDCHDGKKALGDIARSYRSKFSIPVVAITGSNGKTSTKEMIAAISKAQFNTVSTQGNLNNDIGAPLSILNIYKSTEVAVLEAGMNNPGEISYISSIIRPTIAVFTNIGTAHIGNLGSRENIFKAKMELLDFIDADGSIILNADDDMLWSIDGTFPHKFTSFGIHNEKAFLRAINIIEDGNGIKFDLVLNDVNHSTKLKLHGMHSIYNALAAIAVGIELEIAFESIIEQITMITTETIDRQNIIEKNGITIIDDCYNANRDSMLSSLAMFSNHKTEGNKYAVLGDLLELGNFNEEFHEEIGKYANSLNLKGIFTIGESSNKHIESISKNDNIEELFVNLKSILKKDDMVLIKASNAIGLKKLVKLLEGNL